MTDSEPAAVKEGLDILIVDDSPDDSATIRRQLKAGSLAKYSIRECPNATRALRDCLLRAPDCLLLDLRMPDIDGISFLKQLGRDGGVEFPVVMVTSYDDREAAAEALRLGAQDYLFKGHTTPELLWRTIEHSRERFRIAQQLACSNAQVKETNQALRASNEQLEAMFSQSSVGIAQTDLDGRFTIANEAFCLLAGYSRAQLFTVRLTDLADAFEGSAAEWPAERQVQYRRPDRIPIWVHESISPIRDQSGKATARLVMAWDITSQKTAETAQSRLVSLVRASADAITYVDHGGMIRSWNQGAEFTYGYSAAEVVGQRFEILLPADKAAEWQQMRSDAINGRPVQGLETVRLRKDGYRVSVAVTISAVRNPDGELAGFSSIDRDISERRRATEKLQKSELRYRLLANAMPQIVYRTDVSGAIEFVNRQYFEYTGLSEADEAALDWTSNIHPDDREGALAAWQAAVRSGEDYQREHRMRRADGEYRWRLSRAKPVRKVDGTIEHWIGTSTDIHDYKLMESSLRLSEERLRQAQEVAGIVGWDLDLVQDRYTELPGFWEQFQFEPGAVVGYDGWLNRIHPEDRDRIRQGTSDPSRYSDRIEVEFRVIRRDGSVRWLLGRGKVIADDAGRPLRATGVNIDITERKLAETELQESRERLRTALASARMGIWEWDLRTRRLTCSSEIAPLLGLTPPLAMTYTKLLKSVHPEDRDRVKAEVHAALTAESSSTEFRVIWANGSTRWIESQGTLVRAENGLPLRFVGTARDVTERKALEAKAAAAEKTEGIAILAGGLAHDFNNLLVGVIGAASLAIDILPAGHEVCGLLANVIQAGERAAQLTSQMLAYSGQAQFIMGAVDVGRAARESASRVRQKLPPGVQFGVTAECDLEIVGDSVQIGQMLDNLLVNAFESFGNRGGTVCLRLNLVNADQTYLDVVAKPGQLRPGSYVRIQVEDTGSGIDEKTLPKIFEPFFSTRFTGRGLGLAAVEGIVRLHKGAIQVSSRVGEGTTVTVLLPLSNAPRAEQARPCARATSDGPPLILVVDDETTVAKLAATMLEKRGYRTLVANNGWDALENLGGSNRVSLVLLDLTMPGMGGRETLKRIREIDENVPVILSSGYSEEQAVTEVGHDSISGFLRKPYMPRQLIEKINHVLA